MSHDLHVMYMYISATTTTHHNAESQVSLIL